ncbi:MAG: hypothetical protein U9P14_10790 [Gemmatimonadota bacterium]|nr:hypothetical protein [Gemmatimonadota bacterium]
MTMNAAVFIIIIACFVLFAALQAYRRQRLLDQKKAQYLNFKKKGSYHWSRFMKIKADIERTIDKCKMKRNELSLLLLEIADGNEEVRQVLEILKEEIKSNKEETDYDVGRIIDRRKKLLRNRWKDLNGKRTSYQDRRKELQILILSIDEEKREKEREYTRWNETKIILENVKNEYDRIRNQPFFLFAIRGKA